MSGHMVIYRGLPGSGKTYQAEKNQAYNGGRLVGRDHIRFLLGIDGLGTNKQEQEVTDLQTRLIVSGLMAGETVLVDDMNLRGRYVNRLIQIAWKYKATFDIVDLTNVDVIICHNRNILRSKAVPPRVIDDNYTRFIKGKPYPLPLEMTGAKIDHVPGQLYVPNIDKPRAFLVDVDGTVALKGDRGIHDYDKVMLDIPNPGVVRTVQAAISGGLGIPLFLSGRPDSCHTDTRMWLNKHVTPIGSLTMRKTGDRRPDYIVKRELFDDNIRDRYNVIVAFDDRQQVVNMYRDLGITVLQVAEGLF